MSRPSLRTTLRSAATAYADQDYELSRDAAATAVALAPDSVPAHHYLAASLAALGQPRAADRAFHEGLTLAPTDPELLLGLCDLLTGELATDTPALEEAHALAELGHGLATRREDGELALEFDLVCARALTSLGRPQQALQQLAPHHDGANTDLELQRGMAHFEHGELELARACFARALVLEPDEALAHWYLGLISEHDGDSDAALHHIERARRLDPGTYATGFLASARTFQTALDRAVEELSASWKRRLSHFEIAIEALPPRDRLGPISPLALYDLVAAEGGERPPRIALFRRNLERGSSNLEILVRHLRQTLQRAMGRAARPETRQNLVALFP